MDIIKEKREELMSREEVAAALKASVSTVDRLIKNGLLKTVKVGKRVLVPQSEVSKLLEIAQ